MSTYVLSEYTWDGCTSTPLSYAAAEPCLLGTHRDILGMGGRERQICDGRFKWRRGSHGTMGSREIVENGLEIGL